MGRKLVGVVGYCQGLGECDSGDNPEAIGVAEGERHGVCGAELE